MAASSGLLVVADANVVIAALVRPGGWAARQIARDDIEWVTPSFLLVELADHAKERSAKAGCERKAWQRRSAALANRLQIVTDEDTLDAKGEWIDRVERIDADDVPNAAAVPVSGAGRLWTRRARPRLPWAVSATRGDGTIRTLFRHAAGAGGTQDWALSLARLRVDAR